jgi:small redox-active disulfide protein 2
MNKIEVLGTGCTKCTKTAEKIEEVIKEAGIDGVVEKVTDPSVMMQYQVMSTPAVILNGKLVHSGKIPHKEEVLSWF